MDDLTTRVADFASVMNLDVAEAAAIFRSGLAGETEPLRKFGIDLSAASVTVEALATGLADTASELTEQDKVLARYSLLMKETEDTAGDFANTSDDLANATRTLGAKWENAEAVLGEAFIPTLEEMIPLFEKGIDLVVDWGISFAILTGAVSDVDGAIRKSKAGLDKEATAIAFLFDATERLRKELSPGMTEIFVQFGGRILPTAAGAMKQLLDETDNLAETFGLTADDADFLRENAEELADEMMFGTTEAVLELADRLDDDLVKAMNNIAAKEGIKLLENTEDIRDAVLDVTDAVFDNADALETLEDKQKRLSKVHAIARDRAIDLADAQRDLKRAYQEAADPIFALATAIGRAAEAEEIYNEFVETGTELTDDGIEAAFDFAAAQGDVEAAARALDESGVRTGLARLAELMGISVDAAQDFLVEAGIIQALDDFDLSVDLDTTAFDRALENALARMNSLPGVDIHLPSPNIFHSGGVVPGPPGANVPAVLQAGETVRTVSQERALRSGGGGTTVQLINAGVIGSKAQLARWLEEALETVRRQ